jgi:glucosylceramidase
VEVYDLSGKLAAVALDRILSRGSYNADLEMQSHGSRVCVIRVHRGSNVAILTAPILRGTAAAHAIVKQSSGSGALSLEKSRASTDTLVAWAVGYQVSRRAINGTTGSYDITLQRVVAAGSVLVVQTSEAGDVLAVEPTLTFAADDGSSLPTATITPALTYQSILGFGAAFTETSVYNLTRMSGVKQAEVLNAFFNPYTGSGYSLCRTTINSCDFSIGSYSYDDTPGDFTLANFDMSHDMQWMIPSIKAAMAIPGSSFKLFGSPWSPPAWMKASNQMPGGGALTSDCFAAWALYFVKYVTTMQANGIPLWGVTVQNEPQYDPSWEGCVYTPQQERDFVKNYLGPALAGNNIAAKIMILDDNKNIVVNWARVILGDTAAAKYVWGTAYHRYAGDFFDSLSATHDLFPQSPMVGTEGSVRDTWAEAERMAHEILGDLNHWSGGYLTWNLLTNLAGGPYHARGNGCVGPIVVDSASGIVKYNSNYYYMTHFSKYVRPGALRIGCDYTGSGLEIGAFKNTDGVTVFVALNTSDNPISFKVKQGTQIVKPTIPAHALMDFIY